MNFLHSTRKITKPLYLRRALQVLAGMMSLLLICVPAFSQGSTGRITGTVVDQSGGSVANATVTVLDVERGVSRTLTTDDAGIYNAPNLTPGTYTVRAEAKGFKKLERQNVVVEVGHELRIDLTVQPGEQNQTVTVTESVPLVETTNATMGGTLESSDIVDLPLNGRDFQNLLGLRPGVMLQPGGGPWTQSTNGVRPDESVWLVEGVLNANFFDSRPVMGMPSPFTDGATILPVDAIQEFNLMENPKAEYGWKAGAIVNVGIKSGTNTLHGDAFAFGRYQDWDARNYFNIASIGGSCALGAATFCDKVPAQLQQFGGVAGGAIKKDKLFFFGGYEGLRSLIGFVGAHGTPATQSVGDPTLSMVDAIASLQSAGKVRSAISEKLAGCTGDNPTQVSGVFAAVTCTGNLFPNVGASNNFLSTFPTTNVSDNGVGKLDWHPNDKSNVSGVFYYGNYTAAGEDHPFLQVNSTNNVPIKALTTSASWVYTPNSNVVNELRFGYNRVTFNFVNIDVNSSAKSYGIDTGVTNKEAGGLPSVTICPFGCGGGTPLLGTAFNRPQYFSPNPYYDIQDSVSILKGKHAIKIGGEFTHMEADAKVLNNGRGRLDFATLPDFFSGNLNDGKLLTGEPQSTLTFMNYAGFVQDDWRVTPKLMVNLGLRYIFLTPLKDVKNNLGNFDPASATGLVQQGQAGYNSVYKADPFDFEPRLGFAYDMKGNGTTVIRGGVGLIHETWTLETFEGQFGMQNNNATSLNAIPTGATISCGIAGNGSNQVASISCPSSGGGTISLGSSSFTPGQLCWDPALGNCATAAPGQTTVFPSSTSGKQCGDGVNGRPSPCDIFGVDPNLKLPFVLNYNIGVTHTFGPNLSLEVEYVGNHGYRLLNFADINQAPLGAAYCLNTLTVAQARDACNDGNGSPTQEARPYFNKFPYIGFINYVTNRSYSNYNSLQVSLTQRMSHGLSFNVGYTYGHSLDSGSLNRFGLNPQNSINPAAGEYGNSDFDIRHRLTATVTYNIPGIKGYGQMLEGWQINTIVNYATAQPWQTYDPSDNFSGTGENADRWNIAGKPGDFPSGKVSIPNCFTQKLSNGSSLPFDGNSTADAGAGGALVADVACGVTSIYGFAPSSASFTTSAISGCLSHAAAGAGSLPGGGALGSTLATGGCYISSNGSSYILPASWGSFGNMGRNILRDSGFKSWDVSIFKNFTFKERYGIQARWEVFNVINRPIAANPSGASSFVNTDNSPGPGAVFGASFLTPDFAAGNPLIGSGSQRVMQVGLKLTF